MDESNLKILKDPFNWLYFYWSKYYYQKCERGYIVKAVELWLYAFDKGYEVPEDVIDVVAEWVRNSHNSYNKSKLELTKEHQVKENEVSARASWLDCYDNKKDAPINVQKLFAEWVRKYLENYIAQHRSGDHFKKNDIDRRREKNSFNAFRDYRIFKFVNFMVSQKKISKSAAIDLYANFTERMALKRKHPKAMTVAAIKGAYNRMKNEQAIHGNYLKDLHWWERNIKK